MFFKYLIVSVENNKKRYFPAHPLADRVFQVDGEFIPAGTEEDTELDRFPVIVDPSITDKVRAGAELKPMGSVPPLNGLAASEVAESFVARFSAAGRVGTKPKPAEPAEPAEPAKPSLAPAEPVK